MDPNTPHQSEQGTRSESNPGGPGGNVRESGNLSGLTYSMNPRNISNHQEQKPGLSSRPAITPSSHMSPAAMGIGSAMREREHSVGAWSVSSVGTGDSRGGPSSSLARNASTKGKGKTASGGRSGLSGPSARKKKDKHSLALRSIREFLKGRSCYDCLPVSFRLVVLDTKLVVKPALDIMWQAGIVSAPLWQSSTEPAPSEKAESVAPSQNESLEPGSAVSPASQIASQSESVPSSRLAASPSPSPFKRDSASNPSVHKTGFAGMFTVNDIIHLIQYYYQNSSYDNASQDVERFRLEMLRDIEQSLDVPPPPLLSIDPMRPIFDACQLLMKTHARRLPLLDHDEQTGMDVVVSVLTQYRVLKFIAMNCRETAGLNRSIKSLGIGTYIASMRTGMTRSMTMSSAVSSSRRSSNAANSILSPGPTSETGASDFQRSQEPSPAPVEATSRRSSHSDALEPLATATLDTTVFDVVHVFSEKGISGIPILDEDGYVVDLYETVDVIDLVRTNAYQSLDLTIRQALSRRSKEFQGVITCSPDDSLATIFALLRTRRVHRVLILEPEVYHNSVQSGPSGAITIETEKSTHAAIASDVGAVGDIQQDADSNRSAANSKDGKKGEETNAIFHDMPRKNRGKLVGILCLSDIMRYIIGANGQTSQPVSHTPSMRISRVGGGAVTNATASTTGSSVDQTELAGLSRPGQGLTEGGLSALDATLPSANDPSGADSTLGISMQPPAARFDPNDMPPTIEEHPVGEQSTPPPPIPPSLHEDQTPTQEKSADSAVSGSIPKNDQEKSE